MSQLHELLLLQIVSRNGNIATFINQGFTYVQIFAQIKLFEQNDLVIVNKETNSIEITQRGIARIHEINTAYRRINSSAWISPLYEKMVKKIKSEDVYLPLNNKNRQ